MSQQEKIIMRELDKNPDIRITKKWSRRLDF